MDSVTLPDITPQSITCRIFTWLSPQPLDEIDTMAPAAVY